MRLFGRRMDQPSKAAAVRYNIIYILSNRRLSGRSAAGTMSRDWVGGGVTAGEGRGGGGGGGGGEGREGGF